MENKEKLAINPVKEIIPQIGYGEYIEGYSNTKDPFNYKFLWWNIFPIVGQILVLFYVLFFFLNKLLGTKHYVYIYKEGILWKSHNVFSNKDAQIRYDEIGGIKTSKVRHYKLIYGIRKYNCTEVVIDISDKNGNSFIKHKFNYRNENEEESKYNALGYAMKAIMNIWNEYAFERFKKELSEKGYGTFYSTSGKQRQIVEIGQGYIKSDGNYAGAGFRYNFQNGLLYIYPTEEDLNFSDKKEYFVINVNDMYDRDIFLFVASKLLGIK